MASTADDAPGSDRAPTDRRVRRTLDRLRDAIIAVLGEKGYDGTRIKDVLDRADVGRSTFYEHFRSKDELLGSALARLERELRAASAAAEPGLLLPFTLAMVRHVADNRGLHRRLPQSGPGAQVLARVRRLLVALAGEDLAGRVPAGAAVPVDALAEHAIGSFLALLEAWLAGRVAVDAAGLDALFRRLVVPGLQAALDAG